MSDGNYNRNLLPYNNYRSGFNAGHAQMHGKALEAFRKWLREFGVSEGSDEFLEQLNRFSSMLGK